MLPTAHLTTAATSCNLKYDITINIVYCITCKKQATIVMFNMDFDNPVFGSYCPICKYLIAEWR